MRWNMSNLHTYIFAPIAILYDNAKLAKCVCWYHLEIFKVDPPKSKIHVVSRKFGKIKMMFFLFHSHQLVGSTQLTFIPLFWRVSKEIGNTLNWKTTHD